MTDEETRRGCPVTHTEYGAESALHEHYALLDADRERGRFLYNDSRPRGFWMLQRYDDVQEAFQKHDVWTTHVRSALNPSPGIPLLPQDLNGPGHAKLRRVVNQFFAPAAVKRIGPVAHARCVELIEELRPRGECDFVAEFAIRYPTDLFLALLGLPVSDGDFFLPWSETLFASFFGGDPVAAAEAKSHILRYFDEAVNERRKHPRDPAEDLVTRLVQARIDDAPISQDDILVLCTTLMLAGLDTTRSALGYMYAHLAAHPEHRQVLIDDPGRVPSAVEEFLRLYPIVMQAGREVRAEGEFHGLALVEGDVLWLGIAQANRDPRKFPDPDRFDIDRANVNQHVAFGAGPHRCLGMHLARLELQVVLREWHARIPHYRVRPGTVLRERGGQLTMPTLPLSWEV
jgi:cytochrome P450